MKHTTQNQISNLSVIQHTPSKLQSKLRPLSITLVAVLSAFALTACGGSGSKKSSSGNKVSIQGNNGGSTQNATSPLNTTYYGIEQDISDPDVSKRYIDVNKIVIDNGKVTQSTTYSAMGTHQPNNSNPGAADGLILAENFSLKGPGVGFVDIDDFMDTPNSKIRFYPDKIEYVLIDSSNNNTLTMNILGKHIDLSGKKVYDQNSKIGTELKDKNGSVSEVYPQGTSCWAIGYEGIFSIFSKADKPYWQFVPIYPSSLATLSDWQNEVKQDLSKDADSYIDGAFTDVKVGLNNEYNAQMVKIKTNDTNQGIKTTTYKGAIEYEGKIYRVSPIPHPNSTIEIDPKSPYIDEQQCVLYNDVAKDYIIAQLKTLP